MTAISAVRASTASPAAGSSATRIRLKKPVSGWNSVNQMKAVATGGTTSGITNSARTAVRPGSRTSSSSAMPMPSSMQTATNPTVNTAVTLRACPPPVANTSR